MKLPFPISINIVPIIKLIRKSMWWRRLFCKSEPIIVPFIGTRKALLFALNDYPGSENDLNGCLNDQRDVEATLKALYPGFVIKKFANEQVTWQCFIYEVTKAIGELKDGDFLLVHYSGHGTQVTDVHGDDDDGYDEGIYLHDGVVIDDDIKSSLLGIPDGATVVLAFDSCFSGTITRAINNAKPKFMAPDKSVPLRTKKRIRIPKEDMKWMVFSGCREDQTSADAFINGEFHGAFTYYWLKALVPGITYEKWLSNIRKYLPSKHYEQVPTLEGKKELFTKVIFT